MIFFAFINKPVLGFLQEQLSNEVLNNQGDEDSDIHLKFEYHCFLKIDR